MSDKPVLHGDDHRPGGIDPTQPGPWHYVADPGTVAAWSAATAYTPGDTVEHDVYRYLCLIANTNIEPNVDAHWANYWIIDVPLFQNGWTNMTPTVAIPNPVPAGYRLAVGAPNLIDEDTGSLIEYAEHQLDVAGDVEAGSNGTAVYTVPPAYRLPYDKPVSGHDDTMAYVASRLYSAGDFVRGTA